MEHPAFKLIGFRRENLCKSGEDENDAGLENDEAVKSAPHFETIRSLRAAPVLTDVKPVDGAYFGKIWKRIDSTL